MGRTSGDQHKDRRYHTYRDQHGRLWGTWAETESGMPTGGWEYLGHTMARTEFPFYPPVLPPAKYMRPAERSDRVEIDYPRWRADQRAAHREYQRRADNVALAKHGSSYRPEDGITPEVIAVIGKPPLPVELVVACEQENSYALGKTDVVDPRLKKFLRALERRTETYADEYDFRDKSAEAPRPDAAPLRIQSSGMGGPARVDGKPVARAEYERMLADGEIVEDSPGRARRVTVEV